MLKSSVILALLAALLSTSNYQTSYSQTKSGTDNQAVKTIRFYRLNNQLQGIRLGVPKEKSDVIGCHNFRWRKRVAKVVQLGFSYCSLHSKKGCFCLLYTSPSPRDQRGSRMPSSA